MILCIKAISLLFAEIVETLHLRHLQENCEASSLWKARGNRHAGSHHVDSGAHRCRYD